MVRPCGTVPKLRQSKGSISVKRLTMFVDDLRAGGTTAHKLGSGGPPPTFDRGQAICEFINPEIDQTPAAYICL